MRAALHAQLKPEKLRPLGYSDRTQFIRDAIVEKLGLPKELAMMKSREGVGGSPSHKAKRGVTMYPVAEPVVMLAADGPAAAPAAGAASSALRARAAVDRLDADTLARRRSLSKP